MPARAAGESHSAAATRGRPAITTPCPLKPAAHTWGAFTAATLVPTMSTVVTVRLPRTSVFVLAASTGLPSGLVNWVCQRLTLEAASPPPPAKRETTSVTSPPGPGRVNSARRMPLDGGLRVHSFGTWALMPSIFSGRSWPLGVTSCGLIGARVVGGACGSPGAPGLPVIAGIGLGASGAGAAAFAGALPASPAGAAAGWQASVNRAMQVQSRRMVEVLAREDITAWRASAAPAARGFRRGLRGAGTRR